MNTDRNHTDSLAARLSEVEFLFTHLERQVADLSRALLTQQVRMDALERELRSLQRAHGESAELPEDLDEP